MSNNNNAIPIPSPEEWLEITGLPFPEGRAEIVDSMRDYAAHVAALREEKGGRKYTCELCQDTGVRLHKGKWVPCGLSIEKDTEKYTCENCGWSGCYVELIQAGLNHELCPHCEATVLPADSEAGENIDEQNREE